MEIFVAVLLITLFIKTSILYYATLLGIAQLFKLRSYVPLVFPMEYIFIALSIMLSQSAVEIFAGANVWPFVTMPFEIFLPSLTLLIAKIRGLSKSRGM